MYFGAPTSLTVGGVEVGGTLDAPKVAFDIEKVTPDFKNAKGPVKGTVIVKRVVPRLEFMVNELTAAKIAWAMPGVTSTVGTAATTSGGASTTLAADANAGATTISVTSATGISIGDFLKIGDSGETEIREVTNVVSTTVTLGAALGRKHDSGDAVLEVDDAGTTLLTWTPGRVASDQYKDVEAIGPGLDGRTMRVKIMNALSADNLEIPMDDETMAGVAVSMVGHYDPSTPTVAPFEIELF
jgi:hypothetical protein